MWLFSQNNIFHQHNGYKIQLPIISVSCNEQHQVTLHVVAQSDKNDTLPIQCLKVTLLVMVTTCMTTLTRGKVLSWEYRSPRKRNSAGCRTMKQKARPRSGPRPAGPRPGPQSHGLARRARRGRGPAGQVVACGHATPSASLCEKHLLIYDVHMYQCIDIHWRFFLWVA